MKQLGFHFDQTRCIGCETCVVACKDWNDVTPGRVSWRKISIVEQFKHQELSIAFLANVCYHCAEPTCVSVCPADAITKRKEDGIVIVDKKKCRKAAPCGIMSKKTGHSKFSYEEVKSPCQKACPAHISIPGFVALIGKGRFNEAFNLIRENMPLPSVCGRVCLAPCEKVCSRQQIDRSVAVAALKRFVADYVEEKLPQPIPITKGKNVAIIGSGPTGLSAAYDLIKKGYGVTIYEASPVAGGKLAAGLPSYWIPKHLLKRDIDHLEALGIQIKKNTPLGPELTLSNLVAQGYEAIILAMGAQEGTKLKVPGANLEGTLVGRSFLEKFNSGAKTEIGERVVVIGGGTVAINISRVAIRLGAAEVHVACLESKAEMPVEASEVKAAEKEGVTIHASVTVERILGSNAKVAGVKCLSVRDFKLDERGRPYIETVNDTEQILLADTVIFAVDQNPHLSGLSDKEVKIISRRGTIMVDPETLATAYPGIFACGDVVNGPSNVIDAIASGRKAAFYTDRYLQGYVVQAEIADPKRSYATKFDPPIDGEEQYRVWGPHFSAGEKRNGFSEIALISNTQILMAEAKRCLNCAGHLCKDVCPYNVPQFGNEDKPTMQKCDFCSDRWEKNKKPICVDACPMHALDAGPFDEIKGRYGNSVDAQGFRYFSEIIPCVVFKARKK